MKYNLAKKIEKVIDYEPLHNFAIINGEITNIITNQKIDNIENQRNIYNFGNDYIISQDIRGNTYIIDTNNYSFDNNFKIDGFKYPYFTFYEINNKSIEGVYDYNKNVILFTTDEWIGRDIIDNYIFSNYQGTITSRNIKTGDVLWHFDLNQLGTLKKEPYKVLKIIGVLDNKVWIALNNYTLIALDINTGELMHRLSEIKNFDYPFGSIIPAPESMKIDKSRNILYALAWEYYWEINPQTGEIQMWNLFDYFQSLKLRNDLILNYVKIGNIIYFASRNDDCNYESQLAGFNVNTKKIEWQYKFLPNENGSIPQINDLKGNEKMLGALDRDNTLHIFEKTENESV